MEPDLLKLQINPRKMRKRLTLVLLLFVFISKHSTAEYNGVFFTLEIETKSHQKFNAFIYRALVYVKQDSLQSTSYFKRLLDIEYDGINNDTLHYYNHLISYNYLPYMGTDSATLYGVVDLGSISSHEVLSVKYLSTIDFGYLQGFGSTHSIEDTTWFKSPVQDTFMIGSYLCDWQIFLHERVPEFDAIKLQIRNKKKELEAEIENIYNQAENLPYKDQLALEKKAQDLEYSMDRTIREWIHEAIQFKVVIVEFCSC